MEEESLTPNSLSLAKRKPSELPANNHGQGGSKRIRLQNENGFPLEASSSNKPLCLPAENWHRIFSLVPPRSLGSLLRVNKLFHGFLDPPPVVGHVRPSPRQACPSVLPPMKPNAIWQASRELFWPQMPSPLRGKTELDMWRLCCSKSCQFCGARGLAGERERPGEWRLGPGAKGVAPLFPFAFVSCAKCLPDVIIKESDLLLSTSTPSFLMAGLAAAFLSSELHVIPHQVLSSGKDPLHAQVNKVYSSEQVKAITAEFEAVRALGLVLTNGWARGLEARGKIAFADHSRFEKWLLCGGVHQMRTCLEGTQLSTEMAGASSANGVTRGRTRLDVSQRAADIVMTSSEPLINAGPIDFTGSQLASPGATKGSIVSSLNHSEGSKGKRSKEKSLTEAPENPQTAEEAQIVGAPEAEGQSDLSTLQLRNESVANDQNLVGYGALPAPEANSKDRANAANSAQLALSDLVDEIIRKRWRGGQGIRKETAPQFAADVLLETRRRIYSREWQDPRMGQSPKLSINDMKWVFETKISKFIGAPSMDMFWCSECTSQTKPFQLSSVVQHYAAKHTTALSSGRTVVRWQAEWPEKPVFDPNPMERIHKQKSVAPTQAKAPKQTPAVREKAKEGAVTRASQRLPSGNPSSNPTVPHHAGSGSHAQVGGGSNVEPVPANALPARLPSPGQYSQRLVFMAKTWNEMSKEVARVKGLPGAATACLLLYHLVTTFKSQFREPASFTMFLDCLTNQKDMYYARKIKCLQCRACELRRGSVQDRKLFMLPQLAAHFQAEHIVHFDWRVDMISAPEDEASAELRWSLAQHPTVLQLTSRALPGFVPRDFLMSLANKATQGANGNNDAGVQRPSLASAQLVYGPQPPPPQGQSLRVSDPRSAPAAGPGAMRPALVYDVPAESYYRMTHEPSQCVPGDPLVRDRSVAGRSVDDHRVAYAYARQAPQPLDAHIGYRVASRTGGPYRFDDVQDHRVQRPMQHVGARLYSLPAGFVESHGEASRAQSSAAFGREYEDYDPRYPAPDNRGGSLPN
ncbi:hypothetical protein CP532_4854 [Ophiocordyceps camponoti-leonardi (nom. inval.)]|nr:hypothetical protein CP532_4854 [Ophiocordyceps camponoti-leonardi (nom. inval.)]